MSGKVVRVLSMQKFDIDTNDLASEAVVDFLIMRGIDVTQYKEVVMCCRLHSSSTPNNQEFAIELFNDGHTDEDPTSDFLSLLASVSFDSNNSYPPLATGVVVSSTDAISSSVAVKVKLTQSSRVSAFWGILSADLILRD